MTDEEMQAKFQQWMEGTVAQRVQQAHLTTWEVMFALWKEGQFDHDAAIAALDDRSDDLPDMSYGAIVELVVSAGKGLT